MSSDKGSGGVGLMTVVFTNFLILKLTDNIDWSWWWVTSPIWITGVLVLIGAMAVAVSKKS